MCPTFIYLLNLYTSCQPIFSMAAGYEMQSYLKRNKYATCQLQLTRALGAKDIGTGLKTQQQATLLGAALDIRHGRLAFPIAAIICEDKGT